MSIQDRLREAFTDEWHVSETRFDPQWRAGESIFAVGNGYLGVRGTPEEGAPAHDAGTVLNGLHETWPIVYPEDAFGLARTGQTVVNAPDATIVRLFVDDEPIDLANARVRRFERVLDMRAGVLRREVELETPRGRRLLIRSRRLVSLDDRHLMAIDYEVTALDGAAAITLSSELVTHAPCVTADDPRRGKGFAEKVLVPLAAHSLGARAVLHLTTRNSGQELACGIDHRVDGGTLETTAIGDCAQVVVQAALEAGETLRLQKLAAYHWAADAPAGDLPARVHRTLDRATAAGFEELERRHSRHVADFWERSDVQIGGAPELQQAVRFNLFSLMQATARGEGLGDGGQGRDRPRLRGALLLGRRGLRRPVPAPHQPAVGAPAARLPGRDARRGARAGRRGRPPRRPVSVADDHRAGGVGLVRGRHRAVPHQRRHRARDAPLQPRHRRPRVPARARGRGAGGDRALLDGARLLLRAPRRPVLHQRRHRARRVHDGRQQQRLHEPDGQGEPRDRRARRRSGWRAPTRTVTPSWCARPGSPTPRSRAGAGPPS